METLDGGFVLCGATASFGDTLGDAYLICTDSTGQQLWDQHYGLAGVGDYAMELDETSDQGYLIAGEAYIAPGSEVLAICVDSTGSVQWQRTYRHSFSSGAGGLSILPGDSFIVAAASLRGVGLIDLYMIWGDAQGNLFRECTYLFPHPTYEIYPRCLQTMPDGSYLISGSTSDQTDAAFLLRTEPDRLAIGDHDSLVPSEFSVFVYPNPFNSSTTIEFSLPLTSSPLELTLYNTLGQVAYHETLRPTSTLVRHSISAEGLASGVYILSCQVGEMRATQKLLLLR